MKRFGRSIFGAACGLAVVVGCAYAVSSKTSETDPPIVGPGDTYPEWTHFYIFEGHVTIIGNGDSLRAIMDTDVVISGAKSRVPLTTPLARGDVVIDGAIENTGDDDIDLLTSSGEWLTLESGMRAVVSGEEMYGFTVEEGLVAPNPNACLCRCGNGYISLPLPGGQIPPNCGGYTGGNCIDPTNHQLTTVGKCVGGYARPDIVAID